MRFLFVDDALEHVELLVNLLSDLVLEALLVHDALLHLGASLKVVLAHAGDLLQLLDVLGRSLLEGVRLTPLLLLFEEALVAECRVVGR